MRLSAYLGDPGYAPWYQLIQERRRIEVYLDGRRLLGVVMADEELGFVRIIETDAGNKPKRHPNDPDRLLTRVMRGSVRIVIRSRKHDPSRGSAG